MTVKHGGLFKWLVLLSLFMLVLYPLSIMTFNAFGQIEEETKLAEAQNAVSGAFVAVHAAEIQGANVIALVTQLNGAAELLEAAEVAFRNGDYQNASLLADECISKVDGIAGSAAALGNEAESARISQLNISILAASIGLSVLFVVGLFGWRLVKNYYVRRSFRLKPGLVKKD